MSGFGENRDDGEVSKNHSCQNQIAELSGASFNHWGIVVSDEDLTGYERRQDSKSARDQSYYGFNVGPLREFWGNFFAACEENIFFCSSS